MTTVYFRPEMSAHTDSFSPSSDKPGQVVKAWLDRKHIKPEAIKDFEPATRDDFYLAHDRDFVDGVLGLSMDNGFGNRSRAVAASLPYTTGSMIAAAEHVLNHGGHVCSPTSGFHHASYGSAWGFCTFNGLAVAALKLERRGAKVGILDCDAHEGDGTSDILRITGSAAKHHTFGAHFPCGKRASRGAFFGWLYEALDDLKDCDVVLYQAGADPYEHDPLGGQLSHMELSVRDATVFSALNNVAWNLAGGYLRDDTGSIAPVIHIHTNTLLASQGKIKC